jgi:hypothetical protein
MKVFPPFWQSLQQKRKALLPGGYGTVSTAYVLKVHRRNVLFTNHVDRDLHAILDVEVESNAERAGRRWTVLFF